MRARNFVVLCAASSAVAAVTVVTAVLSVPIRAQQTGASPAAISNAEMPPATQEKFANLQAKLKAAQAIKDEQGEAAARNQIGALYVDISEYQNALDSYYQALSAARDAKDTQQETAALNGAASAYRFLGQKNQAMTAYQQAMDLASASGDLLGKAKALAGSGSVDSSTGQPQKALELLNRALAMAQKVNNQHLEATILGALAFVYFGLGDSQNALDRSNQALLIARQTGDRHGEASAFNVIAAVNYRLGQPQKALDYYNQALLIFKELGNRDSEADALNNMGLVYQQLGEAQQTGDRSDEAHTLSNIGIVYKRLGDPQKALDYYDQALPISRAAGDRYNEAGTLMRIGLALVALGELEKALDCYNQALPMSRAVEDRNDEARILLDIGEAYSGLGAPQKALDYYTQALPIYREVRDLNGAAFALNNLGTAYDDLGEKRKALDYYNQSLLVRRQTGDRDDEASTLNNIGDIYAALGEQQRALACYRQALPIFRQIGDREGEAATLNDIGLAYADLRQKQRALADYAEALPAAIEAGIPLLEASICYNVMGARAASEPTLAIFFGKRAVNLLQQVRGNMHGLDAELQKGFLASKKRYYRDLAKLLIDQGRLAEAQQVLDLLKQQEYIDYVRGDSTNMTGAVSLTPAEQQAEQDYEKLTARLVTVSEQWSQLRKIRSRTAEQEQQYEQLSAALANANEGLNNYYVRLYKLFGQSNEANKEVAEVKGDAAALRDQIAHMPHTVALYTLVTSDRYIVLVITGTTIVAREYAISSKELNEKVAAFQQALRDPMRDPRPLGQEIYRILIGPVAADLDQAHAETLVWSLDGVLRYVPMAALYDGKHYLVEKYSDVAITPASFAHLGERPSMENVSAVAMGISRKYEEDLEPLPAVVSELDDVVRDPQVQGANGVLPGTILLNGQFTEKAMESQLEGQHAIVHIASHFVFKPGDDRASYLLLAGKDADSSGYHLTVADFRDNQNLNLNDTDLLTLSACETGVAGTAGDGREVDGLATTAQLKGARAVISTLWEVNDASTGELMADFYRRWAAGGGKVMKVEALRQAQLDLLRGEINGNGGANGRGIAVVENGEHAPAGFAHPYYWAPFVLMGNWR